MAQFQVLEEAEEGGGGGGGMLLSMWLKSERTIHRLFTAG